jgi:hypothetical protein
MKKKLVVSVMAILLSQMSFAANPLDDGNRIGQGDPWACGQAEVATAGEKNLIASDNGPSVRGHAGSKSKSAAR